MGIYLDRSCLLCGVEINLTKDQYTPHHGLPVGRYVHKECYLRPNEKGGAENILQSRRSRRRNRSDDD